jgi:hypothetical protein
MPYGDDAKFQVGMSGRAFNALSSVGNAALYGIETTITGYDPYPGFVPAKAILAAKTPTTTVTASQNRITGRAYKKRTGETFTVPYGATASGQTEFVRQQAILANREAAGSSGHQVTFTPERLRRVI